MCSSDEFHIYIPVYGAIAVMSVCFGGPFISLFLLIFTSFLAAVDFSFLLLLLTKSSYICYSQEEQICIVSCFPLFISLLLAVLSFPLCNYKCTQGVLMGVTACILLRCMKENFCLYNIAGHYCTPYLKLTEPIQKLVFSPTVGWKLKCMAIMRWWLIMHGRTCMELRGGRSPC